MSDLLHRAQLELLAKLLNVSPDRIAYLERFSAADLHVLRERISDAKFDASADMFRRISALMPIVPLSIAMPICQKICPPEMGGKAAGAIALAHPKKVATALSLVKPEYGASAAPYLDPRAVKQVAHLAPPLPIVAIANEILQRQDYVTAGQFVDVATPELIIEVEKGIDDDAGLIRSGAYVYSAKVLNNVVGLIAAHNRPRVHRIIAAMLTGDRDLQLAGLSVFSRLDDDLIKLTGEVLLEEGTDESLTALFQTFRDAGADEDIATLIRHMAPENVAKLASLPGIAQLGIFAGA
jgi:hypothetical protein